MNSLFHVVRVYDKVYEYFRHNGKHGELEQLISTDSKCSYLYAKVIGGRFELGEKVIASDAWNSYFYAICIIGGRFKLGEEILDTDEKAKKKYQEFLESL